MHRKMQGEHLPSSSWVSVTTPSTLEVPLSTATAFLVAAVMVRERPLAMASMGMWLTRNVMPWKADCEAATVGDTSDVDRVDIVIAVAAITATTACMQLSSLPYPTSPPPKC